MRIILCQYAIIVGGRRGRAYYREKDRFGGKYGIEHVPLTLK